MIKISCRKWYDWHHPMIFTIWYASIFDIWFIDYYRVSILATMDRSYRWSFWVIKLFGIDVRISIRFYILNITFGNRNMWNEVWWMWTINSFWMVYIKCEGLVIQRQFHLCLPYIMREVSGWKRNETIMERYYVTSYKSIRALRSPFSNTVSFWK